MGWFGSVSSAAVDEFARKLAQELARSFPPKMEQEREKKVWEKKRLTALEGVFGKAREFRMEHRLGVYKKARLANTFRWEIKEMGYSDTFVETATEGLVVHMTRKK